MTTTPRQIALYLRSSKDRSDVSIDAQRRILSALAASRGWAVVREYADVVLSGKDDNRPGFLDLRKALRARDRGWSAVALLDPERLARNRYVAWTFDRECEKHGVEVVYANLPESNPVIDMILKPALQGIAEYFSWQSKMKGRAGMAENVRQGYRAGGRAPIGYRLERVRTGAVREGEPVEKSRLVITAEAPAMAAYLKARAAGLSRHAAAAHLPHPIGSSSLVGIEWNALTYAGCTVWNVHNEYRPPQLNEDLERAGGGYKGGVKRRPREEWVLQEGTHEALITRDEAERIIGALEASPFKPTRRTNAKALLTGLLRTPDGLPWYSDHGGKAYRVGRKPPGRGRSISASAVDQAIVGKVTGDLLSPEFVRAACEATRRHFMRDDGAELAELRERDRALTQRVSRFLDMAAQIDSPGPVLRKVNEVERERETIAARIREIDEDRRQASAAEAITEERVHDLLASMAEEIEAYDRERLKNFLGAMIERIDLDPQQLTCELHYRIPLNGRNKVASPRQGPPIPLVFASKFKIG